MVVGELLIQPRGPLVVLVEEVVPVNQVVLETLLLQVHHKEIMEETESIQEVLLLNLQVEVEAVLHK